MIRGYKFTYVHNKQETHIFVEAQRLSQALKELKLILQDVQYDYIRPAYKVIGSREELRYCTHKTYINLNNIEEYSE